MVASIDTLSHDYITCFRSLEPFPSKWTTNHIPMVAVTVVVTRSVLACVSGLIVDPYPNLQQNHNATY